MVHAVQLVVPCRQGRLVITPETVSLLARRSLRSRVRWSAVRKDVAGASVTREPGVVGLVICTAHGVERRVDPRFPGDALRVIELLGHAVGGASSLSAGSTSRHAVRMPCSGGYVVLAEERLSYHPRLPWRQVRGWALPFAAIAGASSTTRPGPRLLHDVAIHTTDGRVFALCRLRPHHALALARIFGHLYAALPAEPKSQREAVEYHITTKLLASSAPVPLAIEPARRRAKQRKLERELDDFWSQQRGATSRYRYRPVPSA